MTSIIKERRLYNFDTPKKLAIGDPMYFEQYSASELRKLVFSVQRGLHGNYQYNKLMLTKEVTTYEGMEIEGHTISMLITDFYEDNLNNIFYDIDYGLAPKLLSRNVTLGVDTARLCMSFDDNYTDFRLGGDGYVGFAQRISKGKKFPKGNAILIRIGLDDIACNSLDELEQEFTHLLTNVTRIG